MSPDTEQRIREIGWAIRAIERDAEYFRSAVAKADAEIAKLNAERTKLILTR